MINCEFIEAHFCLSHGQNLFAFIKTLSHTQTHPQKNTYKGRWPQSGDNDDGSTKRHIIVEPTSDQFAFHTRSLTNYETHTAMEDLNWRFRLRRPHHDDGNGANFDQTMRDREHN